LVLDDNGRICTAILIRLRRIDGHWHLTMASAGHPMPLLHRHGVTTELGHRAGQLLGFFDDIVLDDTELVLDPESLLVLYTDGVSEARRSRHFFGENRIMDIVQTTEPTPQTVTTALLDAVLDFQSGHPRDDIAIVALRAARSVTNGSARSDTAA
jgi:sigma-B regulation protein RsbU (phosphoserine phosphatase)